MKIHYFYKREYDRYFYDLELVAWLEETEISRQGNKRLSFTQLERLRIFLSKDNKSYHNHLIKHEFAEIAVWDIMPIPVKSYLKP